jgi:HEAT repeat protein
VGLVRRDTPSPSPASRPEALTRDLLERQLISTDPESRREAALELEGSAEAVPALLGRLAVEIEPTVRDAILTTLVGLDSPPVAAGLVGYLASEDAELRTAVADALAAMPQSVPSLLPTLLVDPDHDVRIMTAMVLAGLRHFESESWLVAMIRDDPHPNVVTAAIDALPPSTSPQHAALLRHALNRFPGDPFLRFVVETTLSPPAGTH